METFPFRMYWQDFPPLARPLFKGFRHPRLGRVLVMRQNLFVNLALPMAVKRHLQRSVMATYRAPFRCVRDRYPILVWPNELPLNDRDSETRQLIKQMEKQLPRMPQPLLLLYFKPGAIIRRRQVERLRRQVPHLETRYCGEGIHYVQEDQPEAIANALQDWLSGAAVTGPAGNAQTSDLPSSTFPASSSRYHWRTLRHDDEDMVAVWSARGLAGLAFVDPDEDAAEVARKLIPGVEPRAAPDDTTDWLDPSIPLRWTGTEFQQRVWQALRSIPAGETRTYKDIAEQLGSHPRAVGQAAGANRIALQVPCHRVRPSFGGVGGYRWGQARKQRLLDNEQYTSTG